MGRIASLFELTFAAGSRLLGTLIERTRGSGGPISRYVTAASLGGLVGVLITVVTLGAVGGTGITPESAAALAVLSLLLVAAVMIRGERSVGESR